MEVTFFPRKDIDVQICDIRHGANAAIVQCTDTLTNSRAFFAEWLGFKYNVRPTAFISPIDGDLDDYAKKDIADTGFMGMGLYFPTDQWKNPNTGVIESIPDYGATAWTQAGVDAFGVTLGAAKTTRTPNHGQQMFNVSGGKYGWDIVNSLPSESNGIEFTGLCDYLSNWGIGIIGSLFSVISYRNGQNPSSEIYIPRFLAGRNSVTNSRTAYGVSKINGAFLGSPNVVTDRKDRISQAVSTRWVDTKSTDGEPTSTGLLNAAILDAKTKQGLYSDFSHHHTTTVADLETLFSLISSAVGSDEVWRCSYGEAFEYFWYRELTKRAVATVYGGEVYITLEWKDIYKDAFQGGLAKKINYRQMNTPLSVRIDLSGTILEGKNIQNSGGNVISLGDNVFIVDVPFGNPIDGLRGVRLSETTSPDYVQNIRPEIVSTTISGQSVTITTNIPTRAVAFQKGASDGDEKYISVFRDNFGTSHTFNLSIGNITTIGVCNKLMQGSLSDEIAI